MHRKKDHIFSHFYCKMPTLLQFRSLELINQLFTPFLWANIVSWNVKTLRLGCLTGKSEIRRWALHELLFAFTPGVVFPMITLIYHTRSSALTSPSPLTSVQIASLTFFITCFILNTMFALSFAFFRAELCLAHAELLAGMAEWNQTLILKISANNKTPKNDVLGIFLNFFVVVVFTASLAQPLGVYFELDTLGMLIKLILPHKILSDTIIRPILISFRVFCQICSFHSGARMYAFTMLVLSVGQVFMAEFLSSILIQTKRSICVNPSEFRRLTLRYVRLTLIIRSLDDLFTPAATGLLSAALILWISSIFITLRFYSILPMTFYFVFPIAAIMIPCSVHVLLPEAVRIFEDGTKILARWKLKFTVHDTKYRTRKVRAMWACRVYSGIGSVRFFHLQKSTVPNFYAFGLYHTISFLISF
jgi:hypothetical protein